MKNQITFKQIQMIYGGLMGGVSLFLVLAWSMTPHVFNINEQSKFKYIIPLILVLAYLLSKNLYRTGLGKINPSDDLSQKLKKYLIANVMRVLPLEAAGLFAVIAFFITSNTYFIIFALLAILALFYFFPSKDKFSKEIELTLEEKSALNYL